MNREHVNVFPVELHLALEKALGTLLFDIHPLSGGTQQRTFLAATSDDFWVVRLEKAPGCQLQRAWSAQQRAIKAGFLTADLVAHEQTVTEQGEYIWSVEAFIQGVEFDPPSFDATMRLVVGRHVGEQLRKLHSIEVPLFGLLPPGATDQAPAITVWLAQQQARLQPALTLMASIPNLSTKWAVAQEILARYTETPRLCHGDFAGTNVLVNETQLVAAVDWEWAKGGDPALDFAWWYFWHEDRPTLQAMIDGYAPTDRAAFTQRVLAYALFHALDTLLLYQAEGNTKGLRYCHEKLQQYCQ